MKFKFLGAVFASFLFSTASISAHAGLIDPDSVLLNESSASQLEAWYGQGDLDWDSIWYGTTGATSASWHNAVDGKLNTFSIYNVTFDNQEFLIGGYHAGAWMSTNGYQHGYDDNFIFNLTTSEKRDTSVSLWKTTDYNVYDHVSYFATFGGGFDLTGSQGSIGSSGSSTPYGTYNGSVSTPNRGNIIDGTDRNVTFIVNSLETFTVSKAVNVPEPSTLAIFALGVIGFAARRLRK